jgi:hypothetical protein
VAGMILGVLLWTTFERFIAQGSAPVKHLAPKRTAPGWPTAPK